MHPFRRALGRYLRLALLVDLAVVGALGLLGLALRWTTPAQWGEGLVWSGLVAAALGGLIVSGAWESRLAFVGYAASVSRASTEERTRTMMADVLGGYQRLLFLLLVAFPLVVAGLVLDPRV